MKQGQLAVETLFAVGAVIMLFIIVLAFTVIKQQELSSTEVFVAAHAECLSLADTLSGVKTLGPTSNASLFLYYKHTILNSSLIRTYTNESVQEIAFCNYLGSVGPYVNISGGIHVQNVAGNVSVVVG
ncbi:MAG TPA: hypothetical protein VJB87_00040 [Candidatus Nanoarchaeia archaeon]|nr:hypothetical protein [Candidatus Nanoarchaeia archaeon]